MIHKVSVEPKLELLVSGFEKPLTVRQMVEKRAEEDIEILKNMHFINEDLYFTWHLSKIALFQEKFLALAQSSSEAKNFIPPLQSH